MGGESVYMCVCVGAGEEEEGGREGGRQVMEARCKNLK